MGGMEDRPILLFDVMGTLVHDPFYEDMPAFFGMTFEQLLPQLRRGPWIEFELGRIDQTTMLSRFFADGRPFDHGAFVAHLRGAYRWLEGVEDLLSELRAGGAAMHVMSNYPIWWELIEERLGLSRYVPWTFVSCRTGVRKPDADAYVRAAGHLGVPPDRCLLVDDRPRNCEAARAEGMDAVERTSLDELRAALAARGLL